MARYPSKSTPKLTDKLIEEMALAIRRGAYLETAAALCGISKDTLYRWLRLAETEQATEPLKKLSYAVKKGLAEAEMRDLTVIDSAAQSGEWTAAAWRLERKFPNKWGRQAKVQVEHSGVNGLPIPVHHTVDLTKLTTDQLLLLEKALEQNDQEDPEKS